MFGSGGAHLESAHVFSGHIDRRAAMPDGMTEEVPARGDGDHELRCKRRLAAPRLAENEALALPLQDAVHQVFRVRQAEDSHVIEQAPGIRKTMVAGIFGRQAEVDVVRVERFHFGMDEDRTIHHAACFTRCAASAIVRSRRL
jgi:hypothetical protein